MQQLGRENNEKNIYNAFKERHKKNPKFDTIFILVDFLEFYINISITI